MEQFLGFCLTFAVGSVGFFLFKLCRVPNPALLGSMFATGALNLAGLFPKFSTWLIALVANMLIGMMIGRQVDRNILNRIRVLAKPVFVQTAGILALSLLCGYTLYLMGGNEIDLLTALISGAAGGITEMMVFGLAVNADVAVIALVQLFRVVVFLSLIPYIALVCDKLGRSKPEQEKQKRPSLPHFAARDYVPLIVAGIAGSLAGVWLDIPSGGMLGAVFACGLFALAINKVYKFDTRLRFAAQIGLGLIMGGRMTPEIAAQLWQMLVPAVVVTLVMLAGCTVLALVLRAGTGWDLTTCLLCSAPAGLSQITVFADEIGVDSFVATVFHTVRIVGIVTLYPCIVLPLI